ncbi:MAG: pilus assembly protein PilY, partial [Rhodoferax sp.]|nr:pilus assembly protein PilY [Rhodoferax sp.]
STVGVMGEPLVAELDASPVSSADSTGRRIKTTIKQVIQQGSTGISVSSTTTITSIAGRLSWRQINNYQDLKNSP